MKAGSEKPESDQNVILVGFMGAGKSTVGRLLAELMNRQFYDTDDLIQERCGQTIAQIFENSGESYFREMESAIIKEVFQYKNNVVAFGGGALVAERNRKMLRRGVSVYLKWDIDILLARISHDKSRPLAGGNKAELSRLFESRRLFYEEADYTVDCTKYRPAKLSAKRAMTLIKGTP